MLRVSGRVALILGQPWRNAIPMMTGKETRTGVPMKTAVAAEVGTREPAGRKEARMGTGAIPGNGWIRRLHPARNPRRDGPLSARRDNGCSWEKPLRSRGVPSTWFLTPMRSQGGGIQPRGTQMSCARRQKPIIKQLQAGAAKNWTMSLARTMSPTQSLAEQVSGSQRPPARTRQARTLTIRTSQ